MFSLYQETAVRLPLAAEILLKKGKKKESCTMFVIHKRLSFDCDINIQCSVFKVTVSSCNVCARYSDNYYAVAKVRQFRLITRISGDARKSVETVFRRRNLRTVKRRIKDFDDQNVRIKMNDERSKEPHQKVNICRGNGDQNKKRRKKKDNKRKKDKNSRMFARA